MRGFPFRGGPSAILFDDRESSKNMRTVEQICRRLVRAGADRQALLIAVGGGVVGDVAGYVAASFLRGVNLVHVPTTLVAQVDSAIGGKTGVNLPEGKNLVGAFFPPRMVLSDSDALRTLPNREYRSGIYEVIKYAIIGDPQLFRFLQTNMIQLLRRQPSALDYVIPRCIKAKADVVGRDEHESGVREFLNFGHTVGHALETVTGYGVYRHGEAVAWGMAAAALLGVAIGKSPASQAKEIIDLIALAGRLPALPLVSAERMIAAMRADKKTRAGRLRFVISSKMGRAETVPGIPEKVIRDVLRELYALTGVPIQKMRRGR
jgi:3-dehydroquinate synthase